MNYLVLLQALVVAVAAAFAQEEAAPSVAPAPEQPVNEAPAIGAELDALLTRLEGKSRETKSLHAKLRYDKIDPIVGDEQRRFGTLIYEAGPPARFAVHFDRLIVDATRGRKQDRWYIFDGRWLVERLDDEKQFRRYEVVAPDAKPQDADPLALGEGPFPVPLGLQKERLLARFHVEQVEAAEDDPADSVHLRLKPRAGGRDDVEQIDLWYGRETLLPTRASTLHVNGNEDIIDFLETKVNEPVDASLFDTRAPSDRGVRGYLEETRRWGE